MSMDKKKAADALGGMILRRLEKRRGVREELEAILGCCPVALVSELKRRKSASCEFAMVEQIIKRLNHKQRDVMRRAYYLAFVLFDRSSQAFRRLPQQHRKFLRNGRRFAMA